jgi:hypothetical protein
MGFSFLGILGKDILGLSDLVLADRLGIYWGGFWEVVDYRGNSG